MMTRRRIFCFWCSAIDLQCDGLASSSSSSSSVLYINGIPYYSFSTGLFFCRGCDICCLPAAGVIVCFLFCFSYTSKGSNHLILVSASIMVPAFVITVDWSQQIYNEPMQYFTFLHANYFSVLKVFLPTKANASTTPYAHALVIHIQIFHFSVVHQNFLHFTIHS